MLPRDSEDELTSIKIWGFEMALQDVLACNPTALNKFYRFQQEYRLKRLLISLVIYDNNTSHTSYVSGFRLELVDALEQSCYILMSDKCLLEAFCDIPRTGYVFQTIFDCNRDMWLLVGLASGEVISRRLGGKSL